MIIAVLKKKKKGGGGVRCSVNASDKIHTSKFPQYIWTACIQIHEHITAHPFVIRSSKHRQVYRWISTQ